MGRGIRPDIFDFYNSESGGSPITDNDPGLAQGTDFNVYYNCPDVQVRGQQSGIFTSGEIERVEARPCQTVGTMIQSTSEICVNKCQVNDSSSSYIVTTGGDFSDYYVANTSQADRGVIDQTGIFSCKTPVDGEAAYREGPDGINVTPDNSTNCTQADLSGCQQYCKLPNNNIVFDMSFDDLLALDLQDAGPNSALLQESIDNPNKPVIFIDTEWYRAQPLNEQRPLSNELIQGRGLDPYIFIDTFLDPSTGKLDQDVNPSTWSQDPAAQELGPTDKYITCSTGYNHHNASGIIEPVPPELSSYENNVMTCKPNDGEYLGVTGCYPKCDIRPNGEDECIDGVITYADDPGFVQFATSLNSALNSLPEQGTGEMTVRILFIRRIKIFNKVSNREDFLYEYLYRCPRGDDDNECRIVPQLEGSETIANYRQRMAPVGH
jgi:hypothetical protein